MTREKEVSCMAQEVFKRTEKKYLLEKNTYEKLIFRINQYMEHDK